MARNNRDRYVGDNIPTLAPVRPIEQSIRRVVTLTQAEYDALSVYDDATLYCVKA
jgi:hypothetical protein